MIYRFLRVLKSFFDCDVTWCATWPRKKKKSDIYFFHFWNKKERFRSCQILRNNPVYKVTGLQLYQKLSPFPGFLSRNSKGGSRNDIRSMMKLFVTVLDWWKSLSNYAKVSIFQAAGFLDLPLACTPFSINKQFKQLPRKSLIC